MQKADHREYGSADITINKFGNGAVDALFEGLGDQIRVSQRNHSCLTTKFKPFSVINSMDRFGCLMQINYQTTSKFPCHWTYYICTLRRYCTQLKTFLRYTISSRSYAHS